MMLGRWSLVVWSIAVLAVLAPAPAEAQKQADEKVGIGMVPFMNDGDDVEKAMHGAVGQMPRVTRMYNPDNPAEMFATLKKLKKAGKQIDFLVIGGHGSRAEPGIQLAGGDVTPAEVDLPALRLKRSIAERAVADPATKDKAGAKRALAAVNKQLADLESVAESLAPGGIVVLINCSPAATPEGAQFVKNFGELLLGKNGGAIIASKSDVSIGQVDSIRNYLRAWIAGDSAPAYDYFVTGDWVAFDVKAAPDVDDMAGTWQSDWGPVTFVPKGGGRGTPIAFTGYWIQDASKRGAIKTGTFDYRARRVTFTYYQHWNKQNGRVELVLADDGKSMTGQWTQQSGSGSWTIKR